MVTCSASCSVKKRGRGEELVEFGDNALKRIAPADLNREQEEKRKADTK